MTIRIIITGGTFDKLYDAVSGTLTFRDTHLPAILEAARCVVPTILEINQLVDSLDMVEANRLAIRDACVSSPEDRIVITHGTDTMAETAKLLAQANLGKRIVLTGAMVPYAVVGSDAVFNLGSAIAAVQLVDPGVYIAMHGRLFDAHRVRKNREAGVFEEV